MSHVSDRISKPHRIYAEVLEPEALEQFIDAMSQDFVVKGALMPDAHKGYSLPIGGVLATQGYIVPAWVGYDIGCGVAAFNTGLKKDEIVDYAAEIFYDIYETIPTGSAINKGNESWGNRNSNVSDKLIELFNKHSGLRALCSLGGGNHFIEIGSDENDNVWIVVHSGSRKIGHSVAKHYMIEAKKLSADRASFDLAFLLKNKEFSTRNPKKFADAQNKFTDREIEKIISGNLEGYYAFHEDSEIGKQYIKDLEFCLEFALENRKRMIKRVCAAISSSTRRDIDTSDFSFRQEPRFVNRNHNHAERNAEGLWIHRKGATHAEQGMYGVIPGNMRDGSFVVRGLGNNESLNSSSHGAGRVLSRSKANEVISLAEFESSMQGIKAKIGESTKDESAFAYKDIFDVMRLQSDLVEVVHHIKPIINIKA